MSPVIPPAIPPATGIKPNSDSLPISEKISFEVTFSGSGISLFSSFLPLSLYSNFLNKVFISLYFKIFVFAFSRIAEVFLSTKLFVKNSETRPDALFCNSFIDFGISFLKTLSVILGAASADPTVNAIVDSVRIAAFFLCFSGALLISCTEYTAAPATRTAGIALRNFSTRIG